MSGPSTSQQRPARSMASDITKLFRSVSSLPQRAEKDAEPPVRLEFSSGDNRASSSKKRITRIPLFGRTRKVSNHSASSSPYTSTSFVRESTDVSDMPSRPPSHDRDRWPSGPAPAASSNKLSAASLTSKFTAHFSSSQSGKSNPPPESRASASRTSLVSSPSSSGLVPPCTRPSCESTSSAGSQTRSTTPRGLRPAITVSMSDNMDEFKDLFYTQEAPRPKSILKQASGGSQESDPAHTLSPREGPVLRSSSPTVYRRGQTPASILAAAVRDQQAHRRQLSSSSKHSRQTAESDKSSSEKPDGRTTPKMAGARESPRPSQVYEREKTLPSRRPSVTSIQGTDASSLRSRMRPPSSSLVRTKPPSIPLPDVPAAASPDNYSPTTVEGNEFSEMESRFSDARQPLRRHRSHSIPPTTTSSQGPEGSRRESPSVNVDIDNASVEDLRRALRNRNKQCEDLTAYLLRKEESWVTERKTFEKKISVLQRELVRRESEITGLKLIINDDDVMKRPKAGVTSQSRFSPVSTSSPVQSDQEGSINSYMSGPRRVNYQSDSGAESARGSGNESSSSILRGKKVHHRSSAIIGEMLYPSRTGSAMRLPKPSALFQDKSLAESTYSKRLSIASSASSSGSSSLLPPSPSVTMSSLSAIPEGTASNLEGSNPDAEDRRALRAARRVSSSSMTSSSTAASSAYSANIKRSRPPSIAQVLEKSPNMEDVLEKMRPLG